MRHRELDLAKKLYNSLPIDEGHIYLMAVTFRLQQSSPATLAGHPSASICEMDGFAGICVEVECCRILRILDQSAGALRCMIDEPRLRCE